MSGAESAVATGTRPVHDKVTLLAYAGISSWSWFVYAFGACLALLRDQQHSSAAVAGLHGLFFAIGGVIGAIAAPHAAARLGRGLTLRLSILGVCLAIGAFLIPGLGPIATISLAFVTCFFGNLIMVSSNAFIASHQGTATAGALTESVSFAALMGLLAPLLTGFLAGNVFGWRSGVAVSIVMFIVVETIRGANTKGFGTAGQVITRKQGGALPTLTYWALIAAMCYVGAEFCLDFWGVQLIHDNTGMSDATSARGLAVFLGGIFVGRLVGTKLTEDLPTERLLRVCIALGIVMFVITWLCHATFVLFVLLFLTGVSFALIYPLSAARIFRSSNGLNDRAAGASLAFTTAAIALAPFALESLTGRISVHSAFLLVPILLAVSLLVVIVRPVAEPVKMPSEH